MNETERATFIQSQVVCALIEAFGMISENMQRAAVGSSMAYDEVAFDALIKKYAIHHDAVVAYFKGYFYGANGYVEPR